MKLLNVNPFKVGDKVIYLPFQDDTLWFVVSEIRGNIVQCCGLGSDSHLCFKKANF